jgi:hypothetical protein
MKIPLFTKFFTSSVQKIAKTVKSFKNGYAHLRANMVENTWHGAGSIKISQTLPASQPASISTSTWQSFEKDRGEGIHMLGHSLRDVEEQVVDPLQRRYLNTTTTSNYGYGNLSNNNWNKILLAWHTKHFILNEHQQRETGRKWRNLLQLLHAFFYIKKNAQNSGPRIFSRKTSKFSNSICPAAMRKFGIIQARVLDPHWFNADPDTDPAFSLIADPDPDPGFDDLKLKKNL